VRARWSSCQYARRAIAEAKHRSQWTKIYYFEFLRASEGTLSRWSRLHLQSLHPLQFQEGLASGRRPIVKIIAESLSQHDEKHVVPTPLSGIRVGVREERERCYSLILSWTPYEIIKLFHSIILTICMNVY
jgi:hypothetical protein